MPMILQKGNFILKKINYPLSYTHNQVLTEYLNSENEKEELSSEISDSEISNCNFDEMIQNSEISQPFVPEVVLYAPAIQ